MSQRLLAKSLPYQTEVEFRRLLQKLPAGAYMCDAGGLITYYNQRAVEVWGREPELNDPVDRFCGSFKLFNADGSPIRHDECWMALALQENREYNGQEIIVERPDGERLTVLAHANPICDESGRLLGAVNVLVDISERKRAEEALQELNETLEERVHARTQALEQTNAELQRARDLFHTLFHANPMPTLMTDLSEGRLIDANEATLSHFGLKRDELIGRTTVELKLWAEPRLREQFVAEVRQTGHVRDLEITFPHPSGEMRTVLVNAERVDLYGESYLIGSLVDITERVRAEQQVRRLAIELSLAEERERQRIAQMLHDEVQQMLVAAQLTLRLTSEGVVDAETRSSLRQAESYLQEILATTRHLTAELGSHSLNSDGVAEALDRVKNYMADRYGLQVALLLDEEASIPNWDKRAVIIRLVRELLFNVVKHAGVKEARLVLQGQGEDIQIRVEDEGRGFDASSLMTRSGQGAAPASVTTGFGLFSVRERMALIGGRLEIRSAPGAGTRATIILPRALLAA